MKIIRERTIEHIVEYYRVFDRADDPGSGFSFPCNDAGRVDTTLMTMEGRRNLRMCIITASQGIFVDKGAVKYERDVTIHAIGLCQCGEEVPLDGFTCPCPGCGRDYNMSGQLLAPRSQWGEETGESPADVARIP
jgi:hypothetical protein